MKDIYEGTIFMETISIIIPVYNAEKTIRRCLESIIISKYKQYEVILIDDGSTDNSVSIIYEYANKDNRIKIVIQSNAGPSEARNKGLKLAEGDIIAFVDSDDYVRDDYLEQLARAFERKEVDIVFFEFERVTQEGVRLSEHKLPEMKTEYYKNLIALSEKDMFGYTWIKAFRKKRFHKILFKEDMKLFEDEVFTCELLENPVNLYYLKEAIYFYVCTDGSLVRKTHQEYCQLCDKVYHAWKGLLSQMPGRQYFLESKANHMAEVCKYYGLERKVKHFMFYREMSTSDFIKYSTIHDPFVSAIREKKWHRVILMHIKYNIKLVLKTYC